MRLTLADIADLAIEFAGDDFFPEYMENKERKKAFLKTVEQFDSYTEDTPPVSLDIAVDDETHDIEVYFEYDEYTLDLDDPRMIAFVSNANNLVSYESEEEGLTQYVATFGSVWDRVGGVE